MGTQDGTRGTKVLGQVLLEQGRQGFCKDLESECTVFSLVGHTVLSQLLDSAIVAQMQTHIDETSQAWLHAHTMLFNRRPTGFGFCASDC